MNGTTKASHPEGAANEVEPGLASAAYDLYRRSIRRHSRPANVGALLSDVEMTSRQHRSLPRRALTIASLSFRPIKFSPKGHAMNPQGMGSTEVLPRVILKHRLKENWFYDIKEFLVNFTG